jgi:hypothetical protein
MSEAAAYQIDRLRCLVAWATDLQKDHAGEPSVEISLENIKVLADVITTAADTLEQRR